MKGRDRLAMGVRMVAFTGTDLSDQCPHDHMGFWGGILNVATADATNPGYETIGPISWHGPIKTKDHIQ
ncbi:MAG: hypothetical protein AAGE38_02685 [Pseudomonadota bacterium]